MTTNDIEERRRELLEEHNSDRFWPLTKEQANRFHQAAIDTTDPKAQFAGLTLLYTGIRNGELCHMRRNWLAEETVEGKDILKVVIPAAEVCTGGVGPTGKDNADGADLHCRGEVCSKCRGEGRDHWSPKTESGDRFVTVREPDVQDALTRWFDQHEEVPMMHNAVNRRVKALADRAGLERGATAGVTAHDLRDTYATMLVRKGFDRHPIKRIMGHNDPERLEDYFKFVGKHQQREFIDKW